MKLASRSVKSRPVRSRNLTKALCDKPKTSARPSTKNFVSMVSAWRVAMPFHMCEKRHWKVWPVSLDVTSKAATKVLMAPVLAKTGSELTNSPCNLSADADCFGMRGGVAAYRRPDPGSGSNPQALIDQSFFQRGEKQ